MIKSGSFIYITKDEYHENLKKFEEEDYFPRFLVLEIPEKKLSVSTIRLRQKYIVENKYELVKVRNGSAFKFTIVPEELDFIND